jgi:DNA-binding transcriptional LysR family regulator
MTLDVRRMRLLREVALRGTIAATAEALSYTASAVSQQLSALEKEAGTELLERNGRRVRLTEAGRTLVAHTESVLTELERAEAALEAVGTTIAGYVRVAAFPSVTGAVLAPALARLAKQYPALTVTLSDLEPSASLRELKLGELDLAVAHEYDHLLEPADPTLERTELFVEDMFMAVPAGLMPAGRPLRLADLRDQPWIIAPETTACGLAAREACRASGFEPDVRYSSDEFGVVLSLVAAGLGVSFLPALAFPANPPEPCGWQMHRMAGTVVHRKAFAAHRAGTRLRPALIAVLAAMKEAANNHAAKAGW